MKRGKLICIAGSMLVAFLSPSVNAAEPPREGCVAVSKQEFDSAKKQNLLRSRFSTYVRTGRLGRRYYWYCHL